jgi:hypothetical protein
MKVLVDEFKKARKEFIEVVDIFPEDKRETVLFEQWRLKDILNHLAGWAEFQTKTLRRFKMGEPLKTTSNLKVLINDVLIAERSDWSWDKVYKEFLVATGDLIREYESLPKPLWRKKIWANGKTTPKEFIQIEVNHYKNTHGPQIQKRLRNLTG